MSRPNDLTTEPANSAADAKSTSNAAAISNIAGVASWISDASKPNFANSVCSLTTWDAVKAVLAPKLFAWDDNAPISLSVAPATAFNPLNALPNLAPVEIALANPATNATNAITIAPIPVAANAAVNPPNAGIIDNIAPFAAPNPLARKPIPLPPTFPAVAAVAPNLPTPAVAFFVPFETSVCPFFILLNNLVMLAWAPLELIDISVRILFFLFIAMSFIFNP